MSKEYGQFCGLAKAASVLGERWALLVLRDLSVGPRRFKDLHEGLPGIPTNLLTTRLRELEAAGVVERRLATPPARGAVYALTDYGDELGPVLDALGRWGALRMSEPSPDDVITDASLAAALRTAFQPDAVDGEMVVQMYAGPATAWARLSADSVSVDSGTTSEEPDLTVRAGPELRLLLAGRMTAGEALESGVVEISGPRSLFNMFTRAFRVPLEDLSADPRKGQEP